jgi:hypothetical protein
VTAPRSGGGGPYGIDTTSPRGLVAGLVVGLPVVAFGIGGAVLNANDTSPVELTGWVVGLAITHDVVVVPLVLALGWAISQVVRDLRSRAALRFGLLVSAGLCLVAYPLVRGFGRSDAVPSALARDYGRGLAIYLAIVWVLVAAVVVARRRSRPAERE